MQTDDIANDEISLLDLAIVLARHKKSIIALPLASKTTTRNVQQLWPTPI